MGHQLHVAGAAGPFIATVQAGQGMTQESTSVAEEAAVSTTQNCLVRGGDKNSHTL